MKHTYKISGMTCDGCRNHVEQTLSQVEGIEKAAVDLKSGEAVLTMSSHVPLELVVFYAFDSHDIGEAVSVVYASDFFDLVFYFRLNEAK